MKRAPEPPSALPKPAALDDALVRAFEHASLDGARFHHREHLYVAYRYLRTYTLEDAIARYVSHLRALVSALGAADKFHATVTWGYMLLVRDALEASPELEFDALLTAHPELLAPPALALRAFYDESVLRSERARRTFVLPRRG